MAIHSMLFANLSVIVYIFCFFYTNYSFIHLLYEILPFRSFEVTRWPIVTASLNGSTLVLVSTCRWSRVESSMTSYPHSAKFGVVDAISTAESYQFILGFSLVRDP